MEGSKFSFLKLPRFIKKNKELELCSNSLPSNQQNADYADLPFSFLAFFSARFSFNDFVGSFLTSFFASNPFDMAVNF